MSIVTKDQDISQIPHGEFIFCKELAKGFIKRDISELGSTTFEAVAHEIEGLSLEVLNTLGLDSVQFGDRFDENRGEIKIGQQISLKIKSKLGKLPFGIPKLNVINLISDEKSKSRYFEADTTVVKRGTCITVNGSNSTEGFEVKVYTPGGGIVGETIVLEDGSYSTTICNLMVGRFQLTITITGPNGEREELFTTVEVYDENLDFADEAPMTSDPITGEAEPNEEITLFDSNGNIVGMGTANSEGKYSIVPVGLRASSSSVSIGKGDFHKVSDIQINTVTPVLSTFNPLNLNLTKTTVSKSETKTNIVEKEEEKPFIAGDGVACNQVVILLPNGTEVGRGMVDKDGKYKVMLHDITNDYQGDINITFRDIGVECGGEKSIKSVSVNMSDTNNKYLFPNFGYGGEIIFSWDGLRSNNMIPAGMEYGDYKRVAKFFIDLPGIKLKMEFPDCHYKKTTASWHGTTIKINDIIYSGDNITDLQNQIADTIKMYFTGFPGYVKLKNEYINKTTFDMYIELTDGRNGIQ